jgi:hypothetical protein
MASKLEIRNWKLENRNPKLGGYRESFWFLLSSYRPAPLLCEIHR